MLKLLIFLCVIMYSFDNIESSSAASDTSAHKLERFEHTPDSSRINTVDLNDCDCPYDYNWVKFRKSVDLDTIKHLSVDFLECDHFPEEIFQCKSLVSFRAIFLNLEQIDPRISQFENLEKLFISKSRISQIPPEVFELKKLKSLIIAQAKLTSIPTDISKLKNLEEIYLALNSIETIPDELLDLPKLKSLNLHLNRLSKEEVQRVKQRLPHVKLTINAQL